MAPGGVVDPALTQVMLGWLLNWANCPDRGLSSVKRAEAAGARRAAGEGVSVLAAASQAQLTAALDAALGRFPLLCPDVPEERRLRMAARLARILESDRSLLTAQLPATPDSEP